jgi:nucleoside 2-deoxyribosyltransferase
MGVTQPEVEIDSRLVLILTPFHTREQNTFQIISEVCRDVGFRSVRGDEEFTDANILPHILKLMVQARLVIANINGRNPNVFFELGVANAIDKPTIVVSETLGDVPFDLQNRRMIIYKSNTELANGLNRALVQVLAQETRT